MRLAVLILTLLTCGSAAARDPLGLHYPPCMGGEVGYWVMVGGKNEKGETLAWMALSHQSEFPDPATIICWVGPKQRVMTYPLEREKPT